MIIETRNGHTILADDADYELLSKYNWHGIKKGKSTYAYTRMKCRAWGRQPEAIPRILPAENVQGVQRYPAGCRGPGMKLFVWNYADGITENYHDGGGVVVIASTLERAREMIVSKGRSKPSCSALTAEPDLTRDCDGEEWLAIHPDAGCC